MYILAVHYVAIEKGTYLEHCMTYSGLDGLLRTDESFRRKKYEDYHIRNSLLVWLPINITNTVVLDCMYNECLGVVKQLIEFWVKGNEHVRSKKIIKIK